MQVTDDDNSHEFPTHHHVRQNPVFHPGVEMQMPAQEAHARPQ